jgi:CRISPR-associated exonuclease Cas4/CRISPR-associated protein Cas1
LPLWAEESFGRTPLPPDAAPSPVGTAAFERRMGQEITHPIFGYAAQYRQIVEIQCRLLGRHLLGEIERYPNFTTR